MIYGYLSHHGVKGQKWGIRRYQNANGTLTSEGKRRYLNVKSFSDLKKASKEIYKQSYSEYKERNPEATKNQKRSYKKDLNKMVRDIENRYIAKNYKYFKPSKDNVENTVLDIIGIVGGLATDFGGIFMATPIGLGTMAAGLTASSLTLGAKLADGAMDKLKNKRIEEALDLYGNKEEKQK